MQKIGLCNFFLCVLAVLLLGAGIRLFDQQTNRKMDYQYAIAQAEYAAEYPDQTELEALKAEKAELLAQTEALNQQSLGKQGEISALDQDLEALRQEYEQLAQEEDSIYYQTVLQSLSEGVSLVESYIEGNE